MFFFVSLSPGHLPLIFLPTSLSTFLRKLSFAGDSLRKYSVSSTQPKRFIESFGKTSSNDRKVISYHVLSEITWLSAYLLFLFFPCPFSVKRFVLHEAYVLYSTYYYFIFCHALLSWQQYIQILKRYNVRRKILNNQKL